MRWLGALLKKGEEAACCTHAASCSSPALLLAHRPTPLYSHHTAPRSYSLHHQIDVTNAAKTFSVWAAFGGGSIAGTAAAPERGWPADPRLPSLGRRTVLPRGAAPAASATWRDHERWRIEQGVAEGDVEISSGGSGAAPGCGL